MTPTRSAGQHVAPGPGGTRAALQRGTVLLRTAPACASLTFQFETPISHYTYSTPFPHKSPRRFRIRKDNPPISVCRERDSSGRGRRECSGGLFPPRTPPRHAPCRFTLTTLLDICVPSLFPVAWRRARQRQHWRGSAADPKWRRREHLLKLQMYT